MIRIHEIFKRSTTTLTAILLLAVFAPYSAAQTLTSNSSGIQGGYHYEYWKDYGTGTMVLGAGGNFSCSWDAHNILFRKGMRPGVKNQVVTYSADYKPAGNSYLSVYGWTKNPLIEYYIVDGWGTWRPPGAGGSSKGTVTSDGGVYDIYETTRTNKPSIEGTKTFQQYWSVRREKRTSGTISCFAHFDAWDKAGMKMGSLYEVAFNVEGWECSGTADVTMSMTTGTTGVNRAGAGYEANAAQTGVRGHITVTAGGSRVISFMTPTNVYASLKVYNNLGRKIAETGGREYPAGQHAIQFDASNCTKGVYLYTIK